MPGHPFYVTTPIYYANAAPHIGTLYTTVVADYVARFHRLLGDDVRLATGTDEHGEKIYQAALARGQSPQAFVDEIAPRFQQAWREFEIGEHVFMRTTDPRHASLVGGALEQVRAAGDIYFAEYEGRYCVGCERFLTDRELVDGLCPDHARPPEIRREGNWFFRLSRYQGWLRDALTAQPELIRPERFRNEALAMLAEPLGDLSISRPRERVPWGIPLPWDPTQVTYVWFDALLTYLSALGYPGGADFLRFWPATHHLIGKDILKPHAVFWPAMLRALGLPTYRRLLVGGYLLGPDGRKMSKSLGNVVDPFALAARFGVDAVRYYLLREFPYGQDGSVSIPALEARYTADLANTLGNLVNRVRVMLLRYRRGIVPPGRPADEDRLLIAEGMGLLGVITPLARAARTSLVLEQVMSFLQSLNRYVDRQQPWRLARDVGSAERLDGVLANLVEGLRIAAALLEPAIPGKAREIRVNLGLPPGSAEHVDCWDFASTGSRVPAESAVLFPPLNGRVAEAGGAP